MQIVRGGPFKAAGGADKSISLTTYGRWTYGPAR
nr:MAG TPA_asm: hypothetical protein [Caudoviricetes sp.]